jgi:peroxiredoxin Q/BCP
MLAQTGQQILELPLLGTSNTALTLASLKGKKVVLYFYPKDSTPGCTTEGQDFTRLYSEFTQANTLVFGISRDSLASHERFKAKQSFPFELISDENEALCQALNVLVKKPSGKMGIERCTFLLNEEGRIEKEWRKVKVTGHADDVLSAALNDNKAI